MLTTYIQLFRERLSEKVHATIPKGTVGGFEFAVLQRNLKEWHKRPWELMGVCLRVLKESNKRSFDSYSVWNSVLIISHVTFRDRRVHIFADNLSWKSCIEKSLQEALLPTHSTPSRRWSRKHVKGLYKHCSSSAGSRPWDKGGPIIQTLR